MRDPAATVPRAARDQGDAAAPPRARTRFTCETMLIVRVLALLLAVTLTGPSVGALICDWACAAQHPQAATATTCHDHGAPPATRTFASGHWCHELTTPPESILTQAPQVPIMVAVSDLLVTGPDRSAGDDAADIHLHAPPAPPPLLTPLRI